MPAFLVRRDTAYHALNLDRAATKTARREPVEGSTPMCYTNSNP